MQEFSKVSRRMESRNSGSRYGSFDPNRQVTIEQRPREPTWKQMQVSFKQFGRIIDGIFPNYQSVDSLAHSLKKHTPGVVMLSVVVLLACIAASQLGIGAVGFLWGIPALGAAGVGMGFWMCTSHVLLRPDLSDEGRDAAHCAQRMQYGILGASALTMLYFLGMAFGAW